MSKKRAFVEICRPDELQIDRVGVEPFHVPLLPAAELDSIAFLEETIKPLGPPPLPKKGMLPEVMTPLLVQEIKDSEYKNFNVNTTVGVMIDSPIGLRDLGIVPNAMTVLSIGGGFTYKLNKTSNDPTTAVAGMQETEFAIEEIYITGLGVGTAIIRVNWNPDLIRLRP